MELRTDRRGVLTEASVQSLVQEQSIELDHVLPDYYPDVQRLIKCFVHPTVTSSVVDGNRLNYELSAEVRILYCAPGSHLLQCITQTLCFSRSAELPAPGCSVQISATADYCNCRALSSRRIDVRGAVTLRIRTWGYDRRELISDAQGEGLQVRRIPVTFPEKHFHCSRSLVLSEEIELGSAQPGLLHIVRCSGKAVEKNRKFISGKLSVQGELQVQLLYACERDGEAHLEPMQFTIPYSQLLEPEGLEEQDACSLRTEVVSCDVKPVGDEAGAVRLLRCESELRITLDGMRQGSGELAADAFSTRQKCRCTGESVLVEAKPVPFSESLSVSVNLAAPDGEPAQVYDAWCCIREISAAREEDITVSGRLVCFVLIKEKDGSPRLLEKEETILYKIPSGDGQTRAEVEGEVDGCSYTITKNGEISVKADVSLKGILRQFTPCQVLTDIEVLEEAVQKETCALRLYFGNAGESVWDIAKECCTSIGAVMEENDLTEDALGEDTMLLIPMLR